LEANLADTWALWLSPAVLGLFGLLVGSFLNVVIYRWPVMSEREWWSEIAENLDDAPTWQRVLGIARPPAYDAVGIEIDAALKQLGPMTLSRPRSRCGACGHAIRWYENLPILSWLALRARCSACKAPISMRYPLVELATGLLFAGVAWRFGPQLPTLAWCGVMAALVALAMIDQDTGYLPESLTQPLLWSGMIAATLGWTVPWQTALWGAVAGYMSLWLLSYGYQLLRGVPGMGNGDFKLLAGLCAWLGWHALLPIVLMASVVGVAINVPLMLFKKQGMHIKIPFGPFLIGGGLVVIFAGADRVLAWIGVSLPG
jgi:leader peptidase (prepilin peptidase)/N-methyltransferase